MYYDQIDETGTVVRSGFTLGAYDKLPDGHSWVPHTVPDTTTTLIELKAVRREYVNTERLSTNQGYFTHLDKQIAADFLSRGDIDAINGEVNNTGGFPSGWPGAWKCLDNTWLPITSTDEWRALYSSMVNQGTANFAHAQELKAQIDAATTSEQVTNVVW